MPSMFLVPSQNLFRTRTDPSNKFPAKFDRDSHQYVPVFRRRCSTCMLYLHGCVDRFKVSAIIIRHAHTSLLLPTFRYLRRHIGYPGNSKYFISNARRKSWFTYGGRDLKVFRWRSIRGRSVFG